MALFPTTSDANIIGPDTTISGIKVFKYGKLCQLLIQNLSYDGTNDIQLPSIAAPNDFFAAPIYTGSGVLRLSISNNGKLYITTSTGARTAASGIVGTVVYLTS